MSNTNVQQHYETTKNTAGNIKFLQPKPGSMSKMRICTDAANCRIIRLLSGVRYAFYDNVMLRLWRPRVTNCAILSPPSQLHPVVTVAIPGEACSLMVNTAASHAIGRNFSPRTN